MEEKTVGITLVLGGGGSRGIAHIGVLEVLKNADIPIDLIVGTSMGAIVGTLYASGVDMHTLTERIGDLKGTNLFSMNLFSAHARQRSVQKQLFPALKHKTFADLQIPTIVMAVDMLHGKEVAITEGEIIPAVLASSAVPAVFPPVKINGMELADGGVVDSLATHIAYEFGGKNIVAVDVYPPLEKDDPWVDPISAIMGFDLPVPVLRNPTWNNTPSMLSSMWRSFRVMAWHVHEERLQAHPPDVLLRPGVENYGSLDFTDIDGPLEAGIHATTDRLDDIRALISNQPHDQLNGAQSST
ncbi:MAG: patatin-like phospholipase family protein [Aggregatilineales bacterium]